MERRAAYQQTEDVHNTVGGDVYAFQHTTHRAAPTDASSRVFSTRSPGDGVFYPDRKEKRSTRADDTEAARWARELKLSKVEDVMENLM